ncbi:MAG: InlB B-repeat-containing protein, partial [Eubacteriaceae bacterium]
MKVIKKSLTVLFVLIYILTMMPLSIFAYESGGVTYNDNDFNKLQTFLNLPSTESGKTNGQIINTSYNSNDPTTWTGVTWVGGRATIINWSGKTFLNGDIDVSGFTELTTLYCGYNRIDSLTLGDNNALTFVNCSGAQITSLDFSGVPLLEQLYCDNNQLIALNLSSNANLTYLNCATNNLTSLDLSSSTNLNALYCQSNKIKDIKAVFYNTNSEIIARNNGYIYIQDANLSDSYKAIAQEMTNSTFTNWMKGGSVISTNSYTTISSALDNTLYANFSSFVTFDSQGGSAVAQKSVLYNELCTAPSNPAKTDNTFAGWYKEPQCVNAWNFGTDKVTENTTLYAKWNARATSVELNQNTMDLDIGAQSQLTATVLPVDAINKNVTWSSGNENIATVSQDGTVTGVSPGQTIITVTTQDGGKTDTCLVTVLGIKLKTAPVQTQFYKGEPIDTAGGVITQYKAGGTTEDISITADMLSGYDANVLGSQEITVTYLTYTTSYSITVNTMAVTFNSMGGSAVDSVYLDYSNKITPPAIPEKSGCTFAGWYREEALTNEWDFDNDTVTSAITLYAKWTANTYTVSFNCNGGSEISDINADYNTTIAPPADPVKENFIFMGLYKEQTLNNLWNFDNDTIPASNITLYAKWAPEICVVSFDTDGGSAVDAINTNYNTVITAPIEPTKEGYSFSGWYKEDTLTNAWNFENDVVSDNTTLYAKWNANIYIISFDSTGGSVIESVNADYNTKITMPAAPTKTGYTISGWYKEDTLTNAWDFNNDTVPASNITLYAKWNINSYTVNFNSMGGTAVDSVNADYNTKITAPADPEKVGCAFAGWHKEEALTNTWDFENDIVPANNITLYAKWTANTYTISFDSTGGSAVNSIDAEYSTKITAPTAPVKTGYTFAGWYKEDSLTNIWVFANDTVPANNITLYAKWDINSYTVSFNSMGGSSVESVNADYIAKIVAPTAPAKTGYTFAGWYKEEALTNAWDFDNDTIPANNITLYAKWETAIYTVTFKDTYGNIYYSINAEYNTTIEEPYPPILKNEKIFTGWYKDSAKTIAWDFSYDKVTDNVNIYAGSLYRADWLHIDTRGGSQVASVRAYYNQKITPPASPTKEGYTFAGWYKDYTLTIPWDFDNDVYTGDFATSLYAAWIKNEYSNYNFNDYNKMQKFLNARSDYNSYTNGQYLNDFYNQDDPSTWIGIIWSSTTPKRITGISWSGTNKQYLAGTLDVSYLNSLTSLTCTDTRILKINASNCKSLVTISCYDTQAYLGYINEINVDNCTSLKNLYCYNNDLETLDLSTNKSLEYLSCYNNFLDAIYLYDNTNLKEIR